MRWQIVDDILKLPPDSPLPGCKHIPCRVVGTIPWRWPKYSKRWISYGWDPEDFASVVITYWIEKADPKYDPTKGSSAFTYAVNGITWAIDLYYRQQKAYHKDGDGEALDRRLRLVRPQSIHVENTDDAGAFTIEPEVSDQAIYEESADDPVERLRSVAALARLSNREYEIVRRYFLSEGDRMADIGKDLGLSRERVRQLRERAQGKIHAVLTKYQAKDFPTLILNARRAGVWTTRSPALSVVRGLATAGEIARVTLALPTKRKSRAKRQRRAEKLKREREQRIAAGLCTRCLRPRGDSVSKCFCTPCAKKQSEYWSSRYEGKYAERNRALAEDRAARRQRGQCIQCESPIHPGSLQYCTAHLIARRARERTRGSGRTREDYPSGRPRIEGSY